MLIKKTDNDTSETAAQLACARTNKLSIKTIKSAGTAKLIKNFSLVSILICLYEHKRKPRNNTGPIIIIWLNRNSKKPMKFKFILSRDALLAVCPNVDQSF